MNLKSQQVAELIQLTKQKLALYEELQDSIKVTESNFIIEKIATMGCKYTFVLIHTQSNLPIRFGTLEELDNYILSRKLTKIYRRYENII